MSSNTKCMDCSIFKFDGKNNFEYWKFRYNLCSRILMLGCCREQGSKVGECAKNKLSQEKKKANITSFKSGIICFWEDHAYWKSKRSLVYFRQNLQRLQDKKGKVVDFKHRVWSSPK